MGFGSRKKPVGRGDLAPGVRLKDARGREYKLAEITAQGPALLAFFKISCPTCQFTFPFLERLAASSAVRFFGVSQDDARATAGFQRDYGLTFPLLLDDENSGYQTSNAFGISAVPSMFLLEADGRVSWTSSGFSKSELEELGRRAGVEPFGPGEYVPEWKSG